MEFWAQIRPNNHGDLMLYWSQTCLRYVLEFGIWHGLGVFLIQEMDRSNLTKVFGQNSSKVFFPINMIWFNLFILNYISYVMIVNINMFKVLFLYRIRSPEKWAKIITIDIKSWNIKTDLIEEVSCSDKLTATIRKDHVFSLNWR